VGDARQRPRHPIRVHYLRHAGLRPTAIAESEMRGDGRRKALREWFTFSTSWRPLGAALKETLKSLSHDRSVRQKPESTEPTGSTRRREGHEDATKAVTLQPAGTPANGRRRCEAERTESKARDIEKGHSIPFFRTHTTALRAVPAGSPCNASCSSCRRGHRDQDLSREALRDLQSFAIFLAGPCCRNVFRCARNCAG